MADDSNVETDSHSETDAGDRTVTELRTLGHDLTALADEVGRPESGFRIPTPRRWDDAMTHLDRRLRRLEHQVRTAAGDRAIELDAPDPGIVALAEAVDRAEMINRVLLTPRLREACEQTVAAWQIWQSSYATARDAAVAASRVIATSGRDHDRHREAVAEFGRARDQMTELGPRSRQCRNAATNTQRQLDHDRTLRERHSDELAAGRRARAILAARLRNRVIRALDDGALPPLWFVDTMGPGPPVGDATGWWDTAVELLTYRISYRITDQNHPLGQPPGQREPARRRTWYPELTRRLDAYRNPLRRAGR